MKIRSKNIVSGSLIIAVIISLFGINIGNHLCGMAGHSNVSLLAESQSIGALQSESECEFATEPMPNMEANEANNAANMDKCSMNAEADQVQEDCCGEEPGEGHDDPFGSITNESCCMQTADFLINTFELNLPVDYAGFSKTSSNVEFELPLSIQLNSIFETERKHFKEIVYHPYYSNYLHFIQRMLT